MSAPRQAMQMALEAILGADQIDTDMRDAANALRAALSAQEEPAPFGFVTATRQGHEFFYRSHPYLDNAVACTPVYTHPAPTVQPLTDDHIDKLRQENGGALNFVTLREFRVIARAIERAYGIGGTHG